MSTHSPAECVVRLGQLIVLDDGTVGILIDFQHKSLSRQSDALAKTSRTEERNARWIELAKMLIKNDPGRFLDSNKKPVWKRLAEELGSHGHAQGLSVGTVRDILRDNWKG